MKNLKVINLNVKVKNLKEIHVYIKVENLKRIHVKVTVENLLENMKDILVNVMRSMSMFKLKIYL